VPGERPFCLCLAGPNGSGKSTLTEGLRRRFALDGWIDPDEFARYIAHERGTTIDDAISLEAFRAARNARVSYAVNLQNFGFETVFSHGSNLAFLRALSDIGYDVHLYFVGTENPQINIERVRNRVFLGGHAVPEEKVSSRYYRSLRLLSLAIREVERVVLFDNSRLLEMTPGLTVAGRLVCDIRNHADGGNPEGIVLYPPMPNWVLAYALFPYAVVWPRSQLFGEANDLFGDQAHLNPVSGLDKPENRERFLAQFSM
jgi:predicted ABC-type ATPase